MANVDYFLKLDGIDGESMDSKHKNEIDVMSFNWGAKQTGTSYQGGGSGAGKVQMSDFHFTMTTNKASPKLLLNCANGAAIKSAILTCRKAGKDQQEYYKITMTDLLVSSHNVAGGYHKSAIAGAVELPVPTDEISLNYSTISFSYSAQKPDGTLDGAITAGWDLKQNMQK
jgi:type VI secretion system secreted protein Hcp